MGTRLYPADGDECVLAGVPAETAAQLDDYENKQEELGMDAWYNGLFDRPDLDILHNFRVFGWGRLTEAVCRFLEGLGKDPVCGSLNTHIDTVLRLQGVRVPEGTKVTGVSWS